MPKPYTFPYLFDELKNISISKLIEWSYLKENSHKSGVVTWTNRYNEVTSRIDIEVNVNQQYVNLSYTSNETVYNYNVDLVTVPSNLGKGKIWYFICAYTGKRCRILHLIDGKFLHRSALKSGMYSKQTSSKKWRQIERVYGSYFDCEKYYEQLYKKHFKKFYNGKPTKRYLKLMSEIAQAERVSVQDIERLMVKGC